MTCSNYRNGSISLTFINSFNAAPLGTTHDDTEVNSSPSTSMQSLHGPGIIFGLRPTANSQYLGEKGETTF